LNFQLQRFHPNARVKVHNQSISVMAKMYTAFFLVLFSSVPFMAMSEQIEACDSEECMQNLFAAAGADDNEGLELLQMNSGAFKAAQEAQAAQSTEESEEDGEDSSGDDEEVAEATEEEEAKEGDEEAEDEEAEEGDEEDAAEGDEEAEEEETKDEDVEDGAEETEDTDLNEDEKENGGQAVNGPPNKRRPTQATGSQLNASSDGWFEDDEDPFGLEFDPMENSLMEANPAAVKAEEPGKKEPAAPAEEASNGVKDAPPAKVAKAVLKGYCPKGHELVEFETTENGWGCNSCGKVCEKGCSLHSCFECNYDVCKVCVQAAQGGVGLHHDDAAVNANLWLDPDDAGVTWHARHHHWNVCLYRKRKRHVLGTIRPTDFRDAASVALAKKQAIDLVRRAKAMQEGCKDDDFEERLFAFLSEELAQVAFMDHEETPVVTEARAMAPAVEYAAPLQPTAVEIAAPASIAPLPAALQPLALPPPASRRMRSRSARLRPRLSRTPSI